MKEIQKSYSWIISDGTKGMENQSIALAKLLNTNYEIILFYCCSKLERYSIIVNIQMSINQKQDYLNILRKLI